MARKLATKMTLDDLESEVMYTISSLKADPNTPDLVSTTNDWIPWIDDVRALEREIRQLEADTDAARMVANRYLDTACITFGDDLYMAVGKDYNALRWTRFFSQSVSGFVRQGLGRQLSTVKAWLTVTDDDVLTSHRADLERWSHAVETALADTDALALKRGELRQRRETLAANLTAARDALERVLGERAAEKGLGRTWPKDFFKTTPSRSTKNATVADDEDQPTETAGE